MSEEKSIIEIAGEKFREECRSHTDRTATQYVRSMFGGGGKDHRSTLNGCHAKEITMLNDTIKAHGIVGVQYVPGKHGGEMVTSNNSTKTGRRKWMKIWGQMVGVGPMRDNDGYD